MKQPATRKQQQIQARDGEILAVGARLLAERGYHGLTMDRVAEAVGVAKGTVYHHYKSKEDLMAGIAVGIGQRRLAMFRRASLFRGKARERMCAVGIACELFPLLRPEDAAVELHLLSLPVMEKADPERQQALAAVDLSTWECVCGIVRDALAAGELDERVIAAQGVQSAEQLTMGLWSQVTGSQALDTPRMISKTGLSDPGRVTRWNCHRMMDGYGWQPLWSAWDYGGTYRRIAVEVFPEEFAEPAVQAGGVAEAMQ